MHRIHAGIIAIVLLATSAFGQVIVGGRPQDTDVVQTGFAVVIPTIGTGDGLMLFEILSNSVGDTGFESTVWPSPFITSTALVVSSDPTADRNTGIVLVNPGDFTATLALTLRNQRGNIVAARPLVLEPLQHVSQFVSELFSRQPGADATGLLSIDSTVPIVAAGLLFEGPEFSFLPTTATGVFGFPGNLIIPQIAVGGGWSTQIVIANRTGLEQTVRVNFHEPHGRIIATVLDVNIPVAGVVILSPELTSTTATRGELRVRILEGLARAIH